MGKKTRRQLQAEQTRARIVETVGDLMREKDISNVKIREICDKVGVSVGTFYLYFPSKEAAILYGYRAADKAFEDLNLSGTPQNNIELILRTHLDLVSAENLPLIKRVYICHLTYYDDYFFSEERPFFVALYGQIATLASGCGEQEIKDMAWKILNMSRGFIFNLCIRQTINIPNWRERKLSELMTYLKILLGEVQGERTNNK